MFTCIEGSSNFSIALITWPYQKDKGLTLACNSIGDEVHYGWEVTGAAVWSQPFRSKAMAFHQDKGSRGEEVGEKNQ